MAKDALKIINTAKKKKFDDLESLSKEELIDEVIKARVETERAKKGYAVKHKKTGFPFEISNLIKI